MKRILDKDYFYISAVPLYCSCLVEMEKVGELYYHAHKLVTSNPNSAESWYAVVIIIFRVVIIIYVKNMK